MGLQPGNQFFALLRCQQGVERGQVFGGQVEHLLDPALDLLRLEAALAAKAEGDVLEDGQVGEEGVVLEDRVDVALVRRQPGDVLAAQLDEAARRLLEAADHAQRGRLAAARGAEEREELPAADLEVDAVDGDDITEALRDVDEPDLDLGGTGIGSRHWRSAPPPQPHGGPPRRLPAARRGRLHRMTATAPDAGRPPSGASDRYAGCKGSTVPPPPGAGRVGSLPRVKGKRRPGARLVGCVHPVKGRTGSSPPVQRIDKGRRAGAARGRGRTGSFPPVQRIGEGRGAGRRVSRRAARGAGRGPRGANVMRGASRVAAGDHHGHRGGDASAARGGAGTGRPALGDPRAALLPSRRPTTERLDFSGGGRPR